MITEGTSVQRKKRLGEGSKYSRADVLKLKALFDSYDVDKDRRVTINELKSALKADSPLRKQAMSAFRTMDTDKNCVLTFNEYLRSIYPLANEREFQVMLSWVKKAPNAPEHLFEPTPQQLKEIATMFERFDSNHNGAIDIQELVAASSAFGYDEDDVEDLFKTSDLNTNGSISLEEFVQLIKVAYI